MEEVIAHLLVTEGFTSIEEVAFIPVTDLMGIEGFDENVAQELHNRAQAYLERLQEENRGKLEALGMDGSLIEFASQHAVIDQAALEALGKAKVLTLDDFADLSTAELLEAIPGNSLSADEAGQLIMAARASWFDVEEGQA